MTRNWWAYAIQGIAALAFGVLTLVWPGLSLRGMFALFGAFAVVTGVMLVAASFDAARQRLHGARCWPWASWTWSPAR